VTRQERPWGQGGTKLLPAVVRWIPPGNNDREATVRRRDDHGASLVEFALILPVFMMLVLGMFSGGLAYNQKLSITGAAREGARYAATLPKSQFTGPTAASDWLSAIRNVVRDRAGGDLNVSGSSICVSLVTGTSSHPTVDPGYSTNGSSPCYTDGSTDGAARVQVVVQRPGKIEALLFKTNLTLSSRATAKHEAS
jgi:Flp pilus assembly protein TadG